MGAIGWMLEKHVFGPIFPISDQNEGNPIASVLLPYKTPNMTPKEQTKWIFRINLLK